MGEAELLLSPGNAVEGVWMPVEDGVYLVRVNGVRFTVVIEGDKFRVIMEMVEEDV